MTEEKNDSVPVTLESIPKDESQSYWQQTRTHFFHNKLAVASLLVIFIIATISVFCPLIANNRPLMITAVFEDDYDENYFIVLDTMDQLLSGQDTIRTQEEQAAILSESLDEMRLSLKPDFYEQFDSIATRLNSFANRTGNEASVFSEDQITEAYDEFEVAFDLFEVELQAVTKYPLFPTLSFSERFFLIFYIALWLLIPFRKLLPHFFFYLLSAAAIGLVAALIWINIQPQVQDALPYRILIESAAFKESGGEVIRPIIPYGENENITAESRQPPTWLMDDEDKVELQHYHLLGTDTNGRDVLSRMVYGARISMLIGIIAVSIYVSIGILLGSLAGFFGGWIDIALSRLIEIVICFPVLFLILSVQAFLQPSIVNIMIALGLVSWTGVARLERGEFLRLVNQEFVLSARALGGSNLRLIFLHILPNGLGPILVLTSFGIAGSILVESTLSFLGFGVPQPMASWGDLLNNGRDDIQGTWWLTVFPGLAIFITVTCFNLIGEGVRDALDPKRDD